MSRSKFILILATTVVTVLVTHGVANAKVLPYELRASARQVGPGDPVRIRVVLDPANVIAVERMPGFVKVFRGDHRDSRGYPRRGPHVDVPMREVGENQYRGVFSTRKPGIYLIAGMTSTVIDGVAIPRPIRLRVTGPESRMTAGLGLVGPAAALAGLAAIAGGVLLVRSRRATRAL